MNCIISYITHVVTKHVATKNNNYWYIQEHGCISKIFCWAEVLLIEELIVGFHLYEVLGQADQEEK